MRFSKNFTPSGLAARAGAGVAGAAVLAGASAQAKAATSPTDAPRPIPQSARIQLYSRTHERLRTAVKLVGRPLLHVSAFSRPHCCASAGLVPPRNDPSTSGRDSVVAGEM